ncbi:MAG: hypothetical protein ABSE64_08045 [Vulcanimicrobiaceae bacterium]
MPEPFELDRIKRVLELISRFTAAGITGTLFLGIIWLIIYVTTLPSGFPNIGVQPLASIALPVSIGGVLWLAFLFAIFGSPGLVHFRAASISPRRIRTSILHRYNLGALSFYLTLLIISVVFVLDPAVVVSRPMSLLLLFVLIAIIALTTPQAYRIPGQRWLRAFYFPFGVVVVILWYIAASVGLSLAEHMVNDAFPFASRNDKALLVIEFLSVLVLLNLGLAISGLRRSLGLCGAFAFIVILMGWRTVIAQPFRDYRLADYKAILVLSKDAHELQRVLKDCVGAEDRAMQFHVTVKSSLGDTYVVQCRNSSNWIKIPKTSVIAEHNSP